MTTTELCHGLTQGRTRGITRHGRLRPRRPLMKQLTPSEARRLTLGTYVECDGGTMEITQMYVNGPEAPYVRLRGMPESHYQDVIGHPDGPLSYTRLAYRRWRGQCQTCRQVITIDIHPEEMLVHLGCGGWIDHVQRNGKA